MGRVKTLKGEQLSIVVPTVHTPLNHLCTGLTTLYDFFVSYQTFAQKKENLSISFDMVAMLRLVERVLSMFFFFQACARSNVSLMHCFLVLGAIYFWCCVFGVMHCQLYRAGLLPQWRICFIPDNDTLIFGVPNSYFFNRILFFFQVL